MNILNFGDLDLIFKVTAVEKLKSLSGGHLFLKKTLVYLYVKTDAVEQHVSCHTESVLNPCPAESGYAWHLQTV